MPFSEINYQNRAVGILQKAVKNERIAHAYLFAGSKGAGKLETARLFAQAVNCEEVADDSCGVCKNCDMTHRSMDPEKVIHPDIVHLVPGKWIGEDGRKQSSNTIVIGAVRQLCASLYSAPLQAKWRIVIVHDADTMQIQAQNAFLKTLEEPQEKLKTLFILISSRPLKLLSTIRSRCQTVVFGSVSPRFIKDKILAETECDSERTSQIVAYAAGDVNLAMKIAKGESKFGDELLEEREQWLRLWSETVVNKGNFSTLVNEFGRSRNQLQSFLTLLLSWHRDLLVVKNRGNTELISNVDLLNLLNTEAETVTEKQILHRMERIIGVLDGVELYIRGDLALESMFGEIYLGL